ncbi:uncharacterized protein LOC120089037 [Benincasa hispida]|uniref:uncharacterized protein LOC120089037 n=1 Tax=Benincasa hispida TaxID=102211 RepID=UPI00190201D5|nr:uncharacterized protein LOC120089037 [Benincasa hispida]
MGNNCFKSNKVMAQDEPEDLLPPIEAKKVEEKPRPGSAMAKPKTAEARTGGASKKVVRFKLQEEEEKNSGDGGVLRIKVVMSQKELKQMLKDRENNSCTLEELITELKVKGRTTISDGRIDAVEDENGRWKPDLEGIPEGPLIKMSLDR